MATMHDIYFRKGRIAQQLFAWGYPVNLIPEADWGGPEGYRVFVTDQDGKRVFLADEDGKRILLDDAPIILLDDAPIIRVKPWYLREHYRILVEIEKGEWPEVDL